MTITPTRPPVVLYIGGFDFPTVQARGIQTLHTSHALARAGWRVRVLAQRPPKGTRQPTRDALATYGLAPHPRFEILVLPILRPRAPRLEIHARLALSNWSYGLGCLLHVLRGDVRPDVVVVRDPRLAWLFLRTKALHGRPVVYEVHEIFSTRPRDNRSLEPDGVRGVAERTRALERTVFGRSDLLLPLTRCCANLLESEYGVARSRLAVVPDGTTPAFGPLPPREPTRRGVVYAGQLYPWKGVDVLLRAMARLSDVRLAVFGGLVSAHEADPNLAACRSLVQRLGIAERVTFTGPVPHAAIRERLAGAAAAVVPLPDRLMSRYFTSPLKVFEYMAAGAPIVASDLPALREILRDGGNAVLVPPEDPAALARGIERLIRDPVLAERLRRRAFEEVADYTWDRRAARIIEAISPLLKS